MEIKSRLTHSFIELNVDEIQTTIFKSDASHIERVKSNFNDIINDLNRLSGCEDEDTIIYKFIDFLRKKDDVFYAFEKTEEAIEEFIKKI